MSVPNSGCSISSNIINARRISSPTVCQSLADPPPGISASHSSSNSKGVSRGLCRRFVNCLRLILRMVAGQFGAYDGYDWCDWRRDRHNHGRNKAEFFFLADGTEECLAGGVQFFPGFFVRISSHPEAARSYASLARRLNPAVLHPSRSNCRIRLAGLRRRLAS
jgi:hypothetical protein